MPRLYAASDLIDAQLLADTLHSHGIPARVLNAHAAGALGEIPFIDALPEVWVGDPADLARAASVVAEHARRPAAGPDRTCAHCGESSPPNFASCWKCGAWIGREDAG